MAHLLGTRALLYSALATHVFQASSAARFLRAPPPCGSSTSSHSPTSSSDPGESMKPSTAGNRSSRSNTSGSNGPISSRDSGKSGKSSSAGNSSSSSVAVLVGSAQCDWDDPSCEGGVTLPGEKFLHTVEVGAEGELAAQTGEPSDVGGVPAWLTTASTPAGTCLFASLLDRGDVLSLPIGPGAQLQLPGSTERAGGMYPVFSATAEGGAMLIGANYGDDSEGSASVVAYSVGAGCELSQVQRAPHSGGSGVVPGRQAAAHSHGASISPDGLVYVCDLGMDAIVVYKLSSSGRLDEQARTQTPPGCGPRHSVLHPEGAALYVLCELSQVVLTYRRAGGEDGPELSLEQNSTLLGGADTGEGSKAGEILMAPDGSAVFASNRGGERDSVTSFSVGKGDGLLARAGQVAAPAFPRGMLLVHGGSVLLVAGQSQTELASYRVLPGAGLEATGHRLTSGLPPHPAALAVVP